jgi:hypothetical protein
LHISVLSEAITFSDCNQSNGGNSECGFAQNDQPHNANERSLVYG